MNNNELHDVFISYRRYEDEEKKNPKGLQIAQSIYDYLTSKGLKVFWDKPEMRSGSFVEQLEWQLEHSPNYIFIATESAKRFRTSQLDYVQLELSKALTLYDQMPSDRVIIPIFPHMTIEEKQAITIEGPYPQEIQRLMGFHGVELNAYCPTADELREILWHVTAINRSNMWNAGYQWLKQAKENRFRGLTIQDIIMPQVTDYSEEQFPIIVSKDNREEHPLLETIKSSEEHIYLIGNGGVGKTTALLRIMEEAYGKQEKENTEQDRLNGQVPIFIELSRAPDVIPDDRGKEWQVYSSGKSTFIHREIYRQIRRDLKLRQIHENVLDQLDEIYKADYEVAVRPIKSILGNKKKHPEYILLLDGLNEVSRREIRKYNAHGELEFRRSVVSMVTDEIREMMQYKNVRIILTSRSKEAANLSENTVFLYLCGIKKETVIEYLISRHMSQERIDAVLNSERLIDVLRIPLFLLMYCRLDSNVNLQTSGEIMREFYHQYSSIHYTQTNRSMAIQRDVTDSSEGALPTSRMTPKMISFILNFVLPAIAWKMSNAQAFRIERDHLGYDDEGLDDIITHVLTDDSEECICGRYGGYVFPEYTSEAYSNIAEFAQGMIESLGNMQKMINSIVYCAVYMLGVLCKNGNEYSFTHHHFRDYFAAVYQINKLKISVYLYRRNRNDSARKCLSDWKEHPFPPVICQFIGEALGEAHNMPVLDEKGHWCYTVPLEQCERNLIKRALDIYRGRFDKKDGYCVWNLIQIIKRVRFDLRGADFSNLDLTLCEINGHPLGRDGLVTSFAGSRLNDRFFMPAGHFGSIRSAVFSPDDSKILTTADDGTAILWDAETLQEIGTLKKINRFKKFAVYSPDGSKIITASDGNNLKLWDAETLNELGEIKGSRHSNIPASFSPDGYRIVTGSDDGMVRIWEVNTLCEIAEFTDSDKAIKTVSYSPDGRKIVVTSLVATIWDTETLTEIGSLSDPGRIITYAIYSPDGHKLLTLSVQPYRPTANRLPKAVYKISVWQAEDLTEIQSITLKLGYVYSALYSPDGKTIAIAFSDGIIFLDSETLQKNSCLKGSRGFFDSLSYNSDGTKLVTTAFDLQIWDTMTFQEIGAIKEYKQAVYTANFSPNSHSIVTASTDGTAKIWDAETKKLKGLIDAKSSQLYSALYSRDGKNIVTASHTGIVKIWNATTFTEVATLEGHRNEVGSVAFNPTRNTIMTASYDGTLLFWDSTTFKRIDRVFRPADKNCYCAAYSPDGRKILIGIDKIVKIYEAETLDEIGTLQGHTEIITHAIYSPDCRRILTTSCDDTTKLWDADSLEEIGMLRGHTSIVWHAAYSSDGRYIATASSDKTVKVWDAESLQEIYTLKGHTGSVHHVIYSSDDRRILTSSFDGTTKIWDSETYMCLNTIYNIPGLVVFGIDLNHLYPDSDLSERVVELLNDYGASVGRKL